MDIYSILASKPHNPHYLIRYIKFIESCCKKNTDYKGIMEKHHICPKAKDMFPEYKCLKSNKWNLAKLTHRQHFIAHLILWKSYPTAISCLDAIWGMKCRSDGADEKVNSRIYENLKIKSSRLLSERATKYNLKRSAEGLNPFQNEEVRKKALKKSIETNKTKFQNKTHHFFNDDYKNKTLKAVIDANDRLLKSGEHHFLSEKHPMKIRSANKTHHWVGDKNPSAIQAANNAHLFQSSEYQRNLQIKRINEGTHHLLGTVSCVDKSGFFKRISKDVYYSQQGEKENWEYVHFRSKEAKTRKLKAN
jgi:hypothetical protein